MVHRLGVRLGVFHVLGAHYHLKMMSNIMMIKHYLHQMAAFGRSNGDNHASGGQFFEHGHHMGERWTNLYGHGVIDGPVTIGYFQVKISLVARQNDLHLPWQRYPDKV